MSITYAAPGRINLIGDHTDYNLGLSLPIAIEQRSVVNFHPDTSGTIAVTSEGAPGESRFGLATWPGEVTDWSQYVAGVVWALRQAGHGVPGGRMHVASDVPSGAGLSSSAAIECSVMGALLASVDIEVDRITQAKLAQKAENDYVGAPTGLLDQLASMCGEAGKALLVDFLDTTVTTIDFQPEADGVTLLCWDSRAPHSHADGEYSSRRADCEKAAADLGFTSLREAQEQPLDILDSVTDEVARRRARHVLTENRRVQRFIEAVGAHDWALAGELFAASHLSLRDDFENSVPAVDAIVDVAIEAGALGARMTGGGFGGCVIALAPVDGGAAVTEAVAAASPDAVRIPVAAAAGAGVVR